MCVQDGIATGDAGSTWSTNCTQAGKPCAEASDDLLLVKPGVGRTFGRLTSVKNRYTSYNKVGRCNPVGTSRVCVGGAARCHLTALLTRGSVRPLSTVH